ncbi:type VI secretion system Vgr family protein [Sorangium sp. So ce388]|uniref:type VI secretion system Vgr family protein n=1 Tax=Sorangium sp. So ce388 TaxID=3133309 RepID=UPI003F5C425C
MAALQLWVEGVAPELSVRRAGIGEQVSGLFSLAIVACSLTPDLDLDAMILRPAAFMLSAGWGFASHGGRRLYTGLCEAAEQIGVEPSGLSTYAVRLVPRLHLLTLRRDCRIFQRASVPEILERLLDEFAVVHDFRIERSAFPSLDYKVQYNETSYGFLCRLCEEAGLTFTFEADDHRGSVLVLHDAPCAAPPRPGPPLSYLNEPGDAPGVEFVTRVAISREARTAAVATRDLDFRNPAFLLAGRAEDSSPAHLRIEHFHFEPGAYRVVTGAPSATPIADRHGHALHDPAVGARIAEQRLRGEQASGARVAFETSALDLAPGTIVSIADHPHPQLDERRQLLVTRVALDAAIDQPWRPRVEATPADRPYYPPRVTPRPVIPGLQCAVVTGPPGRAIFTDEYGRVRVRFPWDREGTSDEQSSCWIRVSQGWAGAGFGLWTVPRVEQEVLVGFLEGNPDEPIIVGRAPNALTPPPYALPQHATRAVWRSQSTPDADGFNEISFEDQRGQERFYERAERDKESLVRNDERLTVGRHRSRLVRGEEDIALGGSRREEIGGSLHRTVHDEERAEIRGSLSATVGGDRQEEIGGRYAVEVGGAVHVAAGGPIVLEAPDITLKAPGGFVRVTAGGVVIDGGAVLIQKGGGPGAGAGSDPAPPERPGNAGAAEAPKAKRHLPVLAFGPAVPMSPGVDTEQAVICDAICTCKNVRAGRTGRGGTRPSDCVTKRLRAYDKALGGQSTIKAEVPYDMSQSPPAPVMSKKEPWRPTEGKPAGSKVPDVVILKDPTKPPTQDNLKKVVEIKFPPDILDDDQRDDYKRIAGAAPFDVWTPATCGCATDDEEQVPARDSVETKDIVEVAALAVALLVLILDDAVGGQVDDVLIPPTLARLTQKLAPLLVPFFAPKSTP